MMLDYVAANEIQLEEVAELVEGAAEVCRAAGVALVGGETAELPGIYAPGELDFAGTCVGIVDQPLAGVTPGDAIVGFPSAGVHANGFTLVRRVLEEEDYDGPDLLAPTRLYLDVARALRGRAHAFAHVTGGGILGNLQRVAADCRGRLGCVGTAARVRVACSARRGRRAAPRVQPRHRLVRDRARAPRRRARDRAGRMIGVLVSGNGTNLQALIDAGLPVTAVASNRRDAYALLRARAAGIPTATFSMDCHADREERDLVMATWLEEHGVELVVLAGYMHLLTKPFLARFPERIVNVHPSLLPAFPGAHAIDDALAAGVGTTGVTVHVVDEGLDTGPVLAQREVAVEPRETLEERLHAVEHELLPGVVKDLCLARS